MSCLSVADMMNGLDRSRRGYLRWESPWMVWFGAGHDPARLEDVQAVEADGAKSVAGGDRRS